MISGHKGLAFLSPSEITVRLADGRVTLLGESLRVLKASPSEIYIGGRIRSVLYPAEGDREA